MNFSSHAPPKVLLFQGLIKSHLFWRANQFHSTSLPLDNHSVTPTTATTGLVFPANYGVKPEAALVMDWSPQEQYVLEKGLAKYVSSSSSSSSSYALHLWCFWIFPSHLQIYFLNYFSFFRILGIVLWESVGARYILFHDGTIKSMFLCSLGI